MASIVCSLIARELKKQGYQYELNQDDDEQLLRVSVNQSRFNTVVFVEVDFENESIIITTNTISYLYEDNYEQAELIMKWFNEQYPRLQLTIEDGELFASCSLDWIRNSHSLAFMVVDSIESLVKAVDKEYCRIMHTIWGAPITRHRNTVSIIDMTITKICSREG